MYIEQNTDTRVCTIWVDQEHVQNYKKDSRYIEAITDSKAKGYAVCVYVGGEMPLLPVIDDMLSSNRAMS